MAMENAINFVQRISEDESFKQQVEGKSKEELQVFIAEQNLDFTLEELEDVCEYAAEQGEELDLEELEKVVGGIAVTAAGVTAAVAVGGLAVTAATSIFPIGKDQGWW